MEDPRLFVEGASRFDIQQGELGKLIIIGCIKIIKGIIIKGCIKMNVICVILSLIENRIQPEKLFHSPSFRPYPP